MDKLNHKNKANWERSGVKKKKKKLQQHKLQRIMHNV